MVETEEDAPAPQFLEMPYTLQPETAEGLAALVEKLADAGEPVTMQALYGFVTMREGPPMPEQIESLKAVLREGYGVT